MPYTYLCLRCGRTVAQGWAALIPDAYVCRDCLLADVATAPAWRRVFGDQASGRGN